MFRFTADFVRVDTENGVFQPLSSFYTDRFHLSVLAKGEAQVALHVEESPYTSVAYLITLDNATGNGVSLELCAGGVRKEDNKCQLLAKSVVRFYISSSNVALFEYDKFYINKSLYALLKAAKL